MEKPVRVLGRRVVAHLIDFGLTAGVAALVFFTVAEDGPADADSVFRFEFTVNGDAQSLDGAAGGLFSLGLAVWLFFIYGLVQGRSGQTPGKKLTGIRVVDSENRPPGIARATGRTLMWFVDAFPYFIPWLVGFSFAVVRSDRRRVGDLAAGTWVVREASAAFATTDRPT